MGSERSVVRNITEIPDNWVIISLPNEICKVFATWRDDSWKLNSGISKIEQDDYYYFFHGFSGSCYQCKKGRYGTSHYGSHILDKVLDTRGIELLDDMEDWTKLYIP